MLFASSLPFSLSLPSSLSPPLLLLPFFLPHLFLPPSPFLSLIFCPTLPPPLSPFPLSPSLPLPLSYLPFKWTKTYVPSCSFSWTRYFDSQLPKVNSSSLLKTVGFVSFSGFGFFHPHLALGELTASQNLCLPLLLFPSMEKNCFLLLCNFLCEIKT